MTQEINNASDIIDSRDVIERISDLESELEDSVEIEGVTTSADGKTNLSDEAEELAALKSFGRRGRKLFWRLATWGNAHRGLILPSICRGPGRGYRGN